MPKQAQVYQLKITLKHVQPPVWRRIVVPENISFDILHLLIQIIMGWKGYHLHEFEIENRVYGMPDEDGYFDDETLDESDYRLNKLGLKEGSKFSYIYDFGDDWEHSIVVEKTLPAESEIKYPICLSGKRACPPEDVGGPWGYKDFLEAFYDPEHKDHEDRKEWAGDFDAEHFDLTEINQVLDEVIITKSGNLDVRASEDHSLRMAEFQMELLEPLAPVSKAMTGEEKSLFKQVPLRKNVLVILKYLKNNRVVGTEGTGNFPVKAVREIYQKFENAPMPTIILKQALQRIRSEDDVEQLAFVHHFAYISKLIDGGKKLPWALTPSGEQFLGYTAVEQTIVLFLFWLLALGLEDKLENEDLSCGVPFDLHFSIIDSLFQQPVGVEMSYTQFWNSWANEHQFLASGIEMDQIETLFQTLITQTIMAPMIEFGAITGSIGNNLPLLNAEVDRNTFHLTPLGKKLGEIVKNYVGRE